MSPTGSQLQFAAELLTLLTAGAGLALVGLKAGITGASRWARAALAGGFLAIGGAAFAHGSLLVGGHPWGLTAARLAGDAAVGAGAFRWADRKVRSVLWAGLAVSVAAAVSEAGASRPTQADALLIAGSALIAAGLLGASRHSIVARVAASTAATLLVVVLVLSVALSDVIASSAQRDQLRALGARAGAEASTAFAAAGEALKDARFAAADLAGSVPGAELSSLAAGAQGSGSAAASAVTSRLGLLSGLYPVGGLGYLLPGGQVLTPRGGAGGLVAASTRQALVKAMKCSASAGAGAMLIEASTVVAVAAYPECQLASGKLLGTVVVANRLGGGYLASRHRIDPGISLALATPEAVLSAAGPLPAPPVIESFAARAESTDKASTGTAGRTYLAVEPLGAGAGAAPVVSLVLSSTDASVVQQRDRLERALFLIALGGTLLALLFAAAVGDRITAGLRRLTEVADRVRRGSVGERAGISSTDEVGTLGAAFDSMVASVEVHAAALQAAADDETRLRNRLEAVVAGMGDALVATDSAGAVTDFNAAAEELAGVASGAVMGRRLEDVLHLRLEEETGPLVAGAAADGSGERATMLATLVRADGGEVPVAASKGPLAGPDGRVGGAVLVLRDLRREQELERMKSEFLSRIGHELRTPLTGIIGYADMLLRRRVTTTRAQEWHSQILLSAKRLQRVVELLEFVAASEAGRAMVSAEPLDVRDLAREVCESWAERLPAGVLLQRRVARDTPAVMGDRKWLALALNELVDNAVKFSPAGGRVAITAQRSPVPGAVDISVTDRGVGMAAGDQDAAFAEFVQGDSSDTRRFGGLGLGLALVQRVARAHGGSVLCRSAAGSGSKFTIRLPAEDSRHPTPAKAPAIR